MRDIPISNADQAQLPFFVKAAQPPLNGQAQLARPAGDGNVFVFENGRKIGAVTRTSNGRTLGWSRDRLLGEFATQSEARAAVRDDQKKSDKAMTRPRLSPPSNAQATRDFLETCAKTGASARDLRAVEKICAAFQRIRGRRGEGGRDDRPGAAMTLRRKLNTMEHITMLSDYEDIAQENANQW